MAQKFIISPVQVIHLRSDHCINCFACRHWCPNGAIHPGDADLSIKNYHHPDVKISDMVQEKNKKKLT